jgi:GTP-binding protein
LADRPSLVVGTKLDLLAPGTPVPPGIELAVSAVSGEGIAVLAERLAAVVARARAEEPPRQAYVVLRPAREPFTVRRDGEAFRVTGSRVERWVAETDLDDPRQVTALQRRLIRAGVERRLAEVGARRGDEVRIGGAAFDFIPGGEGTAEEDGG